MASIFHDLVKNFKKKQVWSTSECSFESPLTCLEWAPTNSHCALGHLDGIVSICRINGGVEVTNSKKVGNGRITSVSFNETADLFACTSAGDNNISIATFDHDNSKIGSDFTSFPDVDRPSFLSFMEDVSHGHNILMSGSTNGLKLIDVDSGTMFREFKIRGGCTSIRSWNGCLIAVGGTDKTVQLWDVRVKNAVAIYKSTTSNGRPVFDIDSNNKVLVMSGESGNVHLYDLSTRREIAKRKIHSLPVKSLRISSNMRFLLSTDGERLAVSNMNEPLQTVTHIIDDFCGITGIRWHPNNCSFLTRSKEKMVRHWTYEKAEETVHTE